MTIALPTYSPAQLHGACHGWRGIGCSLHGRKNRERGFANQDAGLLVQKPSSPWLVASVADGHGGDLHCRSDHGSWLAVQCGADEWAELCRKPLEPPLETQFYAQAAKWFPRFVSRRRQAMTKDCFPKQPLQLDTLRRLSADETDQIEQDPPLAYGSTLLSVCISEQYLLAAQLGDGAIIEVDAQGEARYLIRSSCDYALNKTDSLCHVDAQYRFFTEFRSLQLYPPGLLLLCTDGVVNAMAGDDALLAAALQYRKRLDRYGFKETLKRLPVWLEQEVAPYCSDDATMVLLAPAAFYGGTP